MAIEAVSRVGSAYSFLFLLSTWWAVSRGYINYFRQRKNPLIASGMKRAQVCSTLYAYAYARVTKSNLSGKFVEPLPAELSRSTEFDEVEIKWLKIASDL